MEQYDPKDEDYSANAPEWTAEEDAKHQEDLRQWRRESAVKQQNKHWKLHQIKLLLLPEQVPPAESDVNEIAEIVCNNFGNKIKINYGISNKGWIGDVPKFYYDINKIKDEIGWKPNMNSREAITKASAEIYEQFINKSNN